MIAVLACIPIMTSPLNLLALSSLAISLYCIALSVHRLVFSPIAHFPGSKITALTGWYETYYDVFKGGQFTFQIERWHQQYGPIIRINPTEIHISDPDFYDIAYSSSLHIDKLEKFRDRFGLSEALVPTVSHKLHHLRRSALNPCFSKKQINQFSPFVQKSADRLCQRLTQEYKGTQKVVSLNDAWAAYSTDIVFEYCFAWTYNFLNYPGFVSPFTTSIRELVLTTHFAGHFPWLLKLLQSMPDTAVGFLKPTMRPIFQFQKAVRNHTLDLINGRNDAHKTATHKTLMSSLLASDLPQQEKELTRLQHEAAGTVGAGIETTRATLNLATFYLLDNPAKLGRLRDEIQASFPNSDTAPSLAELEKLPYLTSVIRESLRMSYGVAQRLPRTFHQPIRYNTAFTIPPGVPFSMTSYLQHNDPSVFPSPETFIPERWLNNAVKSGTDRPLSRYLVSFSKGTRMCVGLNLAWAELYIGLATVMRKVNFELWETKREDVEMAREYFVPQSRVGSRGVRVIVV